MINDGGSNSVSSEVTKLVGQLPPAVQALTGVDLSKVTALLSSFCGNVYLLAVLLYKILLVVSGKSNFLQE